VRLLASTVDYILADDVIQGAVCDVAVTAVTLGVATIVAAREIVVLVSGRGKRTALGRRAPACTILADLKRDRH
jgi:6-phosphogluconolactonase/glucosamine-6-phosphate isomerase/deaminase